MSREQLVKLYEDLEDPDFELNEELRSLSFEPDLRKVARRLSARPRILEVGAFTGVGAKAINKVFPDVEYLGVEPSRWAADIARKKGFQVRDGAVGSKLEDRKFDLFVAWGVIEHLEFPNEFFNWVTSHSVGSSMVYLTTPNWNSPWRRLFGERWWFRVPSHRSYFSVTTLEKLASAHGWEILECWPRRKFRSLRYVAVRLLARYGISVQGRWIPEMKLAVRPGEISILLSRADRSTGK